MPLLTFWNSNPAEVGQFSIEQVVATAGDGQLKDFSECSKELRAYLSETSIEKLYEYSTYCLEKAFPSGGKVLQDLINELGRRLDFDVSNGRYQGVSNAIGYDGIWRVPGGHTLVVEVKTTDAYRISLDTIAIYRQKLLQNGEIQQPSSILIVVGRQDTGELEAQIRGSRHAWDIRLISVEALLNLVDLKHSTDAPDTLVKIRSILAPFEYTKLDQIIDVVFTAAKDVETAVVSEELGELQARGQTTSSGFDFTPPEVLKKKRDQVVAAVGQKLGRGLIKKTRAAYWDGDKRCRIICTLSKRYDANERYWFAYHPQWDEFLAGGADAYFVLGGIDREEAFAIPHHVMRDNLKHLHITEKPDGTMYWHIKLVEPRSGTLSMLLPKAGRELSIDEFRVPLR